MLMADHGFQGAKARVEEGQILSQKRRYECLVEGRAGGPGRRASR